MDFCWYSLFFYFRNCSSYFSRWLNSKTSITQPSSRTRIVACIWAAGGCSFSLIWLKIFDKWQTAAPGRDGGLAKWAQNWKPICETLAINMRIYVSHTHIGAWAAKCKVRRQIFEEKTRKSRKNATDAIQKLVRWENVKSEETKSKSKLQKQKKKKNKGTEKETAQPEAETDSNAHTHSHTHTFIKY